ncbi:peroxidase [Acinetobacter sp. Ac_877]|uniref:alpha/beta fold hydrolase n=1 Tax=Acinetobacter portensis TaxID=1839785 RepID=UPI00128C59D8|nr:alpha/beta hydrolase [Acinetobacter portensis]MPW40456.1 peroxidase [Acinetobacter portensis]
MPYYTMQDNEKLYVREFGQGQPVLVLSGLGMQSWQWLPFLYALKNQFHFIIPDWRGFGRSSQCAIPQLDAISSHWQDLSTLIDKMQLKDFQLIGYSMGATTAMHGMQYGNLSEHLRSYLHIDQTPKITVDDSWQYGLFGQEHQQFKLLLKKISTFLNQHSTTVFIEDLSEKSRNKLVKIWAEFIAFQSSNKISPFLFKLAEKQPKLQKYVLPIHRLDYLKWYIDNYLYHKEDYRQTISQLNCPTTFFSGEKSTLYPIQGQKIIAKSVANSHQVIFKKSGHTPLINEPIKFTRALHLFLTNRSSP